MSKWSDLMIYMMIREGFTDENGKLRFKVSDLPIRSLVRYNRFLRHLFRSPKYIDQEDIPTLGAQNSPKKQAYAEDHNSLYLAGKLRKTKNSTVIVLKDEKTIPIKLTHRSLVERDLTENETAHFFMDKRRTVQIVVSDELYALVAGYWEECNRFAALESFLRLSVETQTVIKRVVQDRQFRRSVLLFLSYAASRSADGLDLSSEQVMTAAVDEFNHQYTVKTHYNPVCFDDIQYLLDVIEFLPYRGILGWTTNYFSRFLFVYAIVNGLSPWAYGEKKTAQVLADKIPFAYIQTISEYLPFLCDRQTYQEIMDEVLASSTKQAYELTSVEELLFESLTVFEFEPAYIKSAVDVLFEDSISEGHVEAMDRLISGPNGRIAREYIFKRFFESFSAGEAAFHFAASSILNAEALKKGTDPLEEAVESVVLPFSADDLLLAVTRVGLIVWSQLGNRKLLFHEGIVSSVFKETLLENLRVYDRRLYASCASTVHDLILAGYFSHELLINEPKIFQTAIETLRQDDGRMWSMRLLALMPWNDSREIPEDISDLCSEYMQKMETALSKKGDVHEPEVYYGVLNTLGWYREKPLRSLSDFQKIVDFYKGEADETQKRRLRLLQSQLEVESPLQGISQQIRPLSQSMAEYFYDGMK